MTVLNLCKPIVGCAVVVGVIAALQPHIAYASVRSALGWSSASVVTEALMLWMTGRQDTAGLIAKRIVAEMRTAS